MIAVAVISACLFIVSICAPPPVIQTSNRTRMEVHPSSDDTIEGHKSTVFLVGDKDRIRRIFFVEGAQGEGFFIWNFEKLFSNASLYS